jgi:hypothetical protein
MTQIRRHQRSRPTIRTAPYAQSPYFEQRFADLLVFASWSGEIGRLATASIAPAVDSRIDGKCRKNGIFLHSMGSEGRGNPLRKCSAGNAFWRA